MNGLGRASPSPANQLSFANRNDQGVNPLDLQRSLEHGPQGRLMIDRVVRNQPAARHQGRHSRCRNLLALMAVRLEAAARIHLEIRQHRVLQGDRPHPGSGNIRAQPQQLRRGVNDLPADFARHAYGALGHPTPPTYFAGCSSRKTVLRSPEENETNVRSVSVPVFTKSKFIGRVAPACQLATPRSATRKGQRTKLSTRSTLLAAFRDPFIKIRLSIYRGAVR